jgi:hypothetical protein
VGDRLQTDGGWTIDEIYRDCKKLLTAAGCAYGAFDTAAGARRVGDSEDPNPDSNPGKLRGGYGKSSRIPVVAGLFPALSFVQADKRKSLE